MLLNSSGIKQRKEEPSLSLSQCLALQQLTYNPNRIRNFDNFMRLLDRFTLISKISDVKSKFRELIYSLKLGKYEQGSMVFHKPKIERAFGLVLYGSVSVYGHEHAGLRGLQATYVRTIRTNNYFGHMIEMDGYEISHIKADQTTFILQLTTKMMYRILDGILVFPQITEKLNFYRKLPLFKDLEKKRVLKMVEVTEKRIFGIGNMIFSQDTEPENLYIVVFGQILLYKREGTKEIPVSIIGRLQLLGIEEILAHKKYEFSAKAQDQMNILVQIPKQAVLEALDQLPISFKVYQTKSRLRQSRVENSIEKMEQSRERRHPITRASFRQKRRFHTDISQSNAIQSRLHRIRKTTYLTNKAEPFFENEQDFYNSKINKLEVIIRDRYGATYGQKFFNLFEGYELERKHRRRKTETLHSAETIHSNSKQDERNVQSSTKQISTKGTRSRWQFMSRQSQQRSTGSEFLITQVDKKHQKHLQIQDKIQLQF